MKKIFTLIVLSLVLLTSSRAQHFVADMEVRDDTLIFKMKAVGSFSARLFDIELFLRWEEGTDVSFSPAVVNELAFPGVSFDYSFNNPDVADPGYNNVWMYYLGGSFELQQFTDGTVYELFRTTLTGGIPPKIQLVADNSTGVPYYFVALSFTEENFDLDPYYPESAFVDPTGSIDAFFYKDYVFDNNRLAKKVNPNIVSSSATSLSKQKLAALITKNRQYLSNRLTGSTVPRSSNATVVPVVKVYPNPVTDHTLKLEISIVKEDDLEISLVDMAGKVLKKYALHVTEGSHNVSLPLPASVNGQYLLNIISRRNGSSTPKILIK